MNMLPPPMARFEQAFFRLLEKLMVALLAGMVAMVFGNVLLRWVANAGILVSEEMSRFFFVWLTFIGAALGVRRGIHFAVHLIIDRFPPALRRPAPR